MRQKGFTLIELLIVIALLGALAVGLLATIDPFEQLKKGRDTSLRNTTAEFYNANLRYFSTKGKFPWATDASYDSSLVGGQTDVLTELITVGELKTRFYSLAGSANLNKIYLSSTSAEHLAVCFKPESKSFQEDPVTLFAANGSSEASGACKSESAGTGGIDCFYCVQ